MAVAMLLDGGHTLDELNFLFGARRRYSNRGLHRTRSCGSGQTNLILSPNSQTRNAQLVRQHIEEVSTDSRKC
jgi:hypothetical protein